MSDHSISVVRLNSQPDAVSQLAHSIADWLEAANLVRPNPTPGLMQPSHWLPGPAWRDVVEDETWLEHFEGSANNGVDVIEERAAYHAVENDMPPACPRCSTAMPEDTYHGYFESWYGGEEPLVACHNCGWWGPTGDWIGEFSFVVGVPGVTFNNWPELRRAFVDQLRSELGGRTAIVRAHM